MKLLIDQEVKLKQLMKLLKARQAPTKMRDGIKPVAEE